MKVGSLFSGIGGLELGLERAGMEVCWQVDWDDWCQKILEKHWPDVPKYKDIHDVNPEQLEPVDLICGGFPCQPVSLAGRREAQDDPRWLWPHFERFVRVLRPRYVLVENVPGLLHAGIGDILGDLATLRYDTEWQSIPAAAVGAPHLRHRIFIVAYPNQVGWDGRPRVFRSPRWGEPTNSSQWAAEPNVGRVANGVPSRVDRLRGLGNAVVPQVAHWVGERIMEHAQYLA